MLRSLCRAAACPLTARRTGVFIDGDNVSHRQYERILARVRESYSPEPKIMRAYRDCGNRGWADSCERLGVEAVHVPNIPHKNSCDLYMTCDMMDLAGALDTYVVVSNDSDFRHVLLFLRKRGKRTVAVTYDGGSRLLARWGDEHIDIPRE